LKSFHLACFPPKVILIPSTSNVSFPIQFRRNQDFYISSNVELSCNGSLNTDMKWKISNCSNPNCSSQILVDATVITTGSELYIPAQTLPFGVYQLKLTVTMSVSSSLTSSKSVYARITPSGITANLVPLGTSMITSGSDQNLNLNPGLNSVDLDGNQFNASVNDFLSLLIICQ
jgi:hypothetical protein